MAWCHQATSHYLSQCWPRSLSPHDITRPQWVQLLPLIWRLDTPKYHLGLHKLLMNCLDLKKMMPCWLRDWCLCCDLGRLAKLRWCWLWVTVGPISWGYYWNAARTSTCRMMTARQPSCVPANMATRRSWSFSCHIRSVTPHYWTMWENSARDTVISGLV